MNILKTGARHIRSFGARNISPCPRLRFRAGYASKRRLPYTRPHGARAGGPFDDDQFDVNIFEDEIDGPNRKRRRVSPEEIEEEALEDKQESENIVDLEKSIGSWGLKEEDEEDLLDDILSPEEIEELKQDIGVQDDESDDIDDIDTSIPYHILSQKPIPKQAQLHLNKLNELLDEVETIADKPTKLQQDIWRWYSRSKDNVPGFVNMIPKDGWDRLWTSQVEESSKNPQRVVHLKTLATDRESAGWELSIEERSLKVEGTFVEGQQKNALDLFEDLAKGEDGKNSKFLEMGVRMYSLNGNTERAQALVDQLFDFDRTADPRVMTSLVSAYSNRRDEANLLKAWSLFQDLQRRLSSDIRMEDYDAVAMSFLEAGNKDFALAVFRDMMLYGRGGENVQDQVAFSKLYDFVSLSQTPRESTEISLDAIKYLPRQFQNKYFYASWLRKLLSEGQLNAAAQVVELMYERGVRPDAKHLNGLIGAYFRSERSFHKDRAEELAWTMIQRRLDFCNERRRTKSVQQPTQLPPSSPEAAASPVTPSVNDNTQGIRVPVNISRPVPAASIETFCILLQFYLLRGWHAHIRHLHHLLGPAELPMNSFFMNQLLYAELRTQGYRRAWRRFEALSDRVRPDTETWACLWECAKTHVHDVHNTDLTGFPLPRELLRRMLAWLHGLSGQEKTHAHSDMDEALYHEMVRCFCFARDLEGCFVALHTLHRVFGLTPTAPVLRSVLMMMARLLPVRAAAFEKKLFPERFPRRQRARWKTQQGLEREMAHATFLLDTTRQERLAALAERDVLFEDLSAELQALENHKVCLGILLKIMKERRTGGKEGAAMHSGYPPIQRAAAEMGLEAIDVDAALQVELGEQFQGGG